MDDIDDKEIENFLFRVGSEVASEAKDLAPYETGNLERDIQVFDDNISNHEIEVGNSKLTPYAIHVHEGTGIYGIKKKPITPKNKKALKTPYGLKKSVKGQKAQPYLDDALKNYNPDRALSDLGDKISEELFKDIEKNFKTFGVKK